MNETEATSCGWINPLMLLVFPCCHVGQVMAAVSCNPKHRGVTPTNGTEQGLTQTLQDGQQTKTLQLENFPNLGGFDISKSRSINCLLQILNFNVTEVSEQP